MNKLDEKLTPDAKALVRRATLGNKKLVKPVMKIALSNKKNLVKEALAQMSNKQLDTMQESFVAVLAEKASAALEDKKAPIAREYISR